MSYLFQILQQNKPLYWATIGTLIMLGISLIGLGIDDRILLGENVWLKPIKFGMSIPIFCITLAWLLDIAPFKASTKKWLSRFSGWPLVLEIPLVMVQAARGVPSHFNESSLLDGIIFGAMGLLIFINTIVVVWVAIASFIRKFNTSKAMQTAIQLASIAMLISMYVGMVMISAKGHAVGVEDGGPGIPITHWSTEGGDWRAIHFLGMHGWQILPLLVYSLQSLPLKASLINKITWGSGLLYLGILLFFYWRTANGFSLFSWV